MSTYTIDPRLAPVPEPFFIVHNRRGQKKHVLNSKRGVRTVARLGRMAAGVGTVTQDGDMCCTGGLIRVGDGDPVAILNHWPRPMVQDGFHTTTRKMRRTLRVDDMSYMAVHTLKARGGYRIWAAVSALKVAHSLGSFICFEAKPDKHRNFEKISFWLKFKEDVIRTGSPVVIMCQPYGRSVQAVGYRVLRAAAAAGLPTLLLTRGRVPDAAWDFLTYVKGTKRQWGRAPMHVKPLGAGPGDVTEYGGSCGHDVRTIRRARIRSQRVIARKRRRQLDVMGIPSPVPDDDDRYMDSTEIRRKNQLISAA